MTTEHYSIAPKDSSWYDRPPQEFSFRSHALGNSVIIWNFPTFMVSEEGADKLVADSESYPAMILDLRGNPGGAEKTMLRLIGNVMNHDVTVGTKVMRKGNTSLVAKSRGKKTYQGTSRVSAKPAMRGHFKTGHSRPGTLDVVPIAALFCKSHF